VTGRPLTLTVWTLSFVPLSMPFGDAVLPGGLVSAAQLASLCVIGAVVVRQSGRDAEALRVPPTAWWMLGLLCTYVLATPGAASTELAVRQDVSLLIGLLLAVSLSAACRTEQEFGLAVWLFVVGGGVALVRGLLTSSAVEARYGGAEVAGSNGLFSEHNQAGCYAAALMLVCLAMVYAARTTWQRLLAGSVAVLALVQVALSLSRGAWLGSLLGVMVLLVLQTRILTRVLAPAIALSALFLLAAPANGPILVIRERLSTLGTQSVGPRDDRPGIWREALRQAEASPLLGQGPGSFPVVASESGSEVYTVSAQHAHNVLLTVAAEAGLPAALCVVGLTLAVGSAVRQSCRRLSSAQARIVAGVGAALFTFVGQGVVDVTLRNSTISTMLWYLVGLVLAARVVAVEPRDGAVPEKARVRVPP